MKTTCLVLGLLLLAFVSCKKKTDDPDTPSVHSPSFIDLKLKDINILSLSSPYYHFDYRDDKYISGFNFANGLIYDMSYSGDNLVVMKNNTAGTSKDSVQYLYTNNKVTTINVSTGAGVLYHRAFLTYYPSGQLEKMDWELKQVNEPFANELSLAFTYYPDGNVKEIVQHYFALDPIPEITFTDKYENYDDKKNVDGFTLVHVNTNRYPPILLPDITLQVNNAGRMVRSGTSAFTFDANFTYTYDGAGRPLTKTGDYVSTSGPNPGQHEEAKYTYSYYN